MFVDITHDVILKQYDDNGATGAWSIQPLQFSDIDFDGDADLLKGNKQNIFRAYPNEYWALDKGALIPWLPFDYYASNIHPTIKNAAGQELAVHLGDENFVLYIDANEQFQIRINGLPTGVIQGDFSKPTQGTFRSEKIIDNNLGITIRSYSGNGTVQGNG